MIDAAERWLEEDDVAELPYSPFDILENILATEGSDDFSEGLTITFRPYAINLPAVRCVRDHVNTLAIREAKLPNIKRAVRGIKFIGHGLHYPAGLFGREVSDDEKSIWTPIFLETINQLATIASDTSLDPVIDIAIREELQWHKNYSKTGTTEAATTTINALPTTLEHQLTLALHDGWRQLMFEHIPDHQAAEQRQQEWYEKVAKELVKERRGEEIVDMIENRLNAHLRAFGNFGTPGPFVWTLAKLKPEFGHIVCQRVVSKPASPLSCILPDVLTLMAEVEPQKAIETSRCILKTKDIVVTRAVAQAHGWNRRLRPLIEGEFELIHELTTYDDVFVRTSVIRAAQLIAKDHPSIAAELLSLVKFEDSDAVANEMFSTFGTHGQMKWSVLTSEQADRIWEQLNYCPDISDHWITEFLGEFSNTEPEKVLKLLKGRIEYSEAHSNAKNFRPIPYSWSQTLRICESVNLIQFLREIRDWMAAQPASWQRQMWGADVFLVAARGFDDQAISVLDEAVLSGSKNQLEAVGSILRKAPRTFVWDQADFVKRALRTAARYGEESTRIISGGLFVSATSGVRNGRPDQPFSEDIEQRDRSAEIVRTLQPRSVEAKFYRSLANSAKESIQWSAERGEQLVDGRNWG